MVESLITKLLLLLCAVCQMCVCLYTDLSTWERRCFVEDVSDHTLVTYWYDLRIFENALDEFSKTPSKNAKMLFEVHRMSGADKEGKTLQRSQVLTGGEGHIAYYAEDYGEYKFCLELMPTDTNEWETTLARLHLRVERVYAEEEREFEEDTKDTIISVLKKNVRTLNKIRSEQKYYRAREQEFRVTSYLTSSRVIWWGLVTGLTVVCSGLFMMQNMKNFFLSKKLV